MTIKIIWTNCTEQMPPDDETMDCIAESGITKSLQIISADKLHLLLKFGMLLNSARWTEYTPEKWEELNK